MILVDDQLAFIDTPAGTLHSWDLRSLDDELDECGKFPVRHIAIGDIIKGNGFNLLKLIDVVGMPILSQRKAVMLLAVQDCSLARLVEARAAKCLKSPTVRTRITDETFKIDPGRFDRDRWVAAIRRAGRENRPIAVVGTRVEHGVRPFDCPAQHPNDLWLVAL